MHSKARSGIGILVWMALLSVMTISLSPFLHGTLCQENFNQDTECNCDTQRSLHELMKEASSLVQQMKMLQGKHAVSHVKHPSTMPEFKTEIAKMLTGMWNLNDDRAMLAGRGSPSPPRAALNVFVNQIASQLPTKFVGPRCVDWDFRYVELFDPCRELFNFQHHSDEKAFQMASEDMSGLIKGDLGQDMTHVPEGLIDLALVTQVFEHVPHFWNALPNLARMMKENGIVIFSVPFAYKFHPFPGDYYRYSSGSVIHLLESSGFAVCHLVSDGWRALQLHALGLGADDFTEEMEIILGNQSKYSLISGAAGYMALAQKVHSVGNPCTLPKLKLTNEITRDEVNNYGQNENNLPAPMVHFPFGGTA